MPKLSASRKIYAACERGVWSRALAFANIRGGKFLEKKQGRDDETLPCPHQRTISLPVLFAAGKPFSGLLLISDRFLKTDIACLHPLL